MPSHPADGPHSSDEDRLQDYFWKLEKLIPNPYRDWAKAMLVHVSGSVYLKNDER
jgi:hypothetical protein